MKTNRAWRQQGFTLLEVLVAFLILSLALGVVLHIFSLTMRTTDSAATRQQALLLAESRMVALTAPNEISAGRDEGRIDDRFRWVSEIGRFDFPDQDEGLDEFLVPYRIDVTIEWDSNQELTLSTVRLVNEQ